MSTHIDRRCGALRSRVPRLTVRLRLTLFYGLLFALFGAILVLAIHFLAANRFPAVSDRLLQGEVVLGQQCLLQTPAPRSAGDMVACDATARAAMRGHRAKLMNDLLSGSAGVLAVATVVSLGLGWLVAGQVLRPLRTITSVVGEISAHSLHERLALRRVDDELKDLGDTFDGLLGRLEAAFTAQRQFVANASHELRTPLTRQRTLLEVALGDPQATVASFQAACRRVLMAAEQQEHLIEALLTLARSERGLDRHEPFDLRALIDEALTACGDEARRRGLALTADLGAATARGDLRLAERLVSNLVDNAVRHNTAGGWVEITTGTSADRAVLRVANSGPVFSPGDVDRLFQPFQRLDGGRAADRDGLGLGLAIVAAIATAHDADLDTRPLPAGGLSIEIRFPGHPPGIPQAG